jgi:PPP family 3-phenylpropionic acid transporter
MAYSISALFYFLYCAAIGIYVPYWTLYLRHLEFTSLQIATLYSIPSIARIFVPIFTGYIADLWNRRRTFMLAASLGQVLPLVLIIWFYSYTALVILISAFAFLNSIVLPLGEATVQEEHEKGSLDYGRTRLWGTASFIVLALVYGKLLDRVNQSWVLHGIIVCYAAVFLVALFMPEGKVSFRLVPATLRTALATPSTWIFLICVLLMNGSHGTFYGFYSIYLSELGFKESGIGVHWAVAAGTELIIFIFASQILRRYRHETLITFCCLAASIRWFLTATSDSFLTLTLIQSLHAFSFGLFHATCVSLIHKIFPEGSRSIGQSLYYSLGGGIGSMIGVLVSGMFWDQLHGKVYYISAAMMFTAFLVSLRFRNQG